MLVNDILKYYEANQKIEPILQNMPIISIQKIIKGILLIIQEKDEGVIQCKEGLYLLGSYLGYTSYAKRIKKYIYNITDVDIDYNKLN